MPNASYYRAQGELLETLSRNTTDPELARRYRLYAEDYRRRADEMLDKHGAPEVSRVPGNDDRRHQV
jgi:hypothetical protein